MASVQLVEPLIQDVLEIEHSEIKALSSLLVVVKWTSFPWKRISQNTRDYIVVKPSINNENTESVLRQISANMTLGCDSGLTSLAGAKNAEIYLYIWKVRPRVGQFLQSLATRFPTIPIGPYEKRVNRYAKVCNPPRTRSKESNGSNKPVELWSCFAAFSQKETRVDASWEKLKNAYFSHLRNAIFMLWGAKTLSAASDPCGVQKLRPSLRSLLFQNIFVVQATKDWDCRNLISNR